MEVKFKVDDREVLARLAELRSEDRVTAWAEAILQLTKEHARERIGGPFGSRIAEYVEMEVRGETAEIRMNRQNAYIGAHVHFGGPIRTRNGKPLAIPLPTASSRKYNPDQLFARLLTVPLFKLTSRAGNELLFRKPEKKQALEPPLFVLKEETRPQRPRPWWPTQAEAEARTKKYFEEEF